uniref:Uncharacterized protein n=1 Tax=Trichuris muris TaxID=70415 RepID=A0A5S6PZI7_TRIMR
MGGAARFGSVHLPQRGSNSRCARDLAGQRPNVSGPLAVGPTPPVRAVVPIVRGMPCGAVVPASSSRKGQRSRWRLRRRRLVSAQTVGHKKGEKTPADRAELSFGDCARPRQGTTTISTSAADVVVAVAGTRSGSRSPSSLSEAFRTVADRR